MADARNLGAGDDPLDHVDCLVDDWRRELPDVDTNGLEIFGRARRINQRVGFEIDALLKRFELDAGQFYVLNTLLRSGRPYALRPTDIFQALMISSGGLTDRLERLEKSGLVRRFASDADARSVMVQLTDAGRTRAEAAFRADMTAESRLMNSLDFDERKLLGRLLRKLALAVGA